MSLTEITPFIAGPVMGVLSLWLGFLAYKRGVRADENADENAANAQVYAGYGGLQDRQLAEIAELRRQLTVERESNAALRERLRSG